MTKREKHKREYSDRQDNFIREIKYRYITADTKKKQDFYAKILSCISFF